MAIKVDELSVIIQANADQFHEELQGVIGKLEGLQTSAGSAAGAGGMGALTTAIFGANFAAGLAQQAIQEVTKIVQDGIAAVQQMATEVVNLGEKLSAMTVTTDIVSKNVGTTTDELNKMRAGLAGIEVHGADAETMIRRLATSGLTDFTDSLERVNAVGGGTQHGIAALGDAMLDLATGAGVDAADGMSRLTQFIRTGRGMAVMDMVSTTKLTQYYKEYADSLGTTSDKLSQLQLAQAREQYIMSESMRSFGTYAAGMQKAGQLVGVVNDMWKDMAADLGKALSPIFDTFMVGVYQLTLGIRGALGGTLQPINNWANQVAGYILAAFRMIGAILSQIPFIGKNFYALANLQMQPLAAVNKLTSGVEGLGDAMNAVTDNTNDAKKALAGLASFDEMNVLKSPTAAGAAGGGGIGGGGSLINGAADLGFDAKTINSIADEAINGLVNAFSIKNAGATLLAALFPIPALGIWLVGEMAKVDWGAVDEMMKKQIGMGIGDTLLTALFPMLGLLNYFRSQMPIFKENADGIVGIMTDMAGVAVGQVVAMAESIKDELLYLNLSEKPITQAIADTMVKSIEDMKNRGIAKLKENTTQALNELKYLRDTAKVITAEQYDQMAATITEKGQAQIDAQNNVAAEIEKRIQALKDKGVTITSEMRTEITTEVELLETNTVKALTDGDVKQTAILEKLKLNSGKITAEMAAEAIKQSIAVRDQTISDADKKYETTIEDLVKQRDEYGTITQEQFDTYAQKALDDKNKAVQTATDKHNGVVDQVKLMGSDITDQIDLDNGKVKSKWDQFWDSLGTKISTWWNETAVPNLKLMWENIKNWFDQAGKDITKAWNDAWNGLGEETTRIWNGVKESIRGVINSIIGFINNNFIAGINSAIRSYNNFADSTGNVVFKQINWNVGNIAPIPADRGGDGRAGTHALGGVFTTPTLGIIGEAGKEVVMPLENNTGWINELAQKINNSGGGSMNLTVKIGEDTIFEKAIDYINDKTMATNSQILKI